MRQLLKRWLFRLFDIDPEAVIVTFMSGDPARCVRMAGEVRHLLPNRRHFLVTLDPTVQIPGFETLVLDDTPDLPLRLYYEFRRRRVGLAPVLFDETPSPLRAAAFALAPGKILAYNGQLERHHLQLRSAIASLLFLRGVPLDRIFLRPSWLCPWKRDRTTVPREVRIIEGRPRDPARRAVGIVTPYYPYPLAHGGAVRMFHLIREAASTNDIHLFAFARNFDQLEVAPLVQLCTRITLVAPPHYREPRWSTLNPPEAGEFNSPVMREEIDRARPSLDLVQVEYTQLVPYGGDILVEHDLTQDLYRQVHEQNRTLSTWWNWFRWRRFEKRALRRYRCSVVMSAKDALAARNLGCRRAAVLPNGVDLNRFRPERERAGEGVLFIGSFNHFPNVEAFRFFHERVWPHILNHAPGATWTVIAGRDHQAYWRNFTGSELPRSARVEIHDFVRDVRPFYEQSNLVVVPTPISAGTNLKVLEAMAMCRAVVSTTCGCAGLGLRDGESVLIADEPEAFAEAVVHLLKYPHERLRLAQAARVLAERNFGWAVIGQAQEQLWAEMSDPRPRR